MCYVNWGLSSLLHVMHVCREVNFASSSSWMYIAYIFYWFEFTPFIDSLFWTQRGRRICYFCFYFKPFVDDWQKGGEVFWYICMFLEKGFMFMHICFCFANRRKRIWCVLCLNCMFISLHLHTCLWAFIAYLFIYCDAWVKGSFFEALL